MGLANYYTEVKVGSDDISTYILNYVVTDSSREVADLASLRLSPAILASGIDLTPGAEITVRRGTASDSLIYLFRGYITKVKPQTTRVVLTCRNKLWALKQRQANVSFDKNIDGEAGKLSEMILTLITQYGGLSADSDSIQDSGTTLTLNKYLCINDEVFERVMKLVDALGWTIYYNPVEDKVYCEPFGYRNFYETIRFDLTGGNINPITLPSATYDYDKLVNKVTINGAKQLDTKFEEFTGDGAETDFTLEYTPFETEVTVGGTLQVKGVRGQSDETTFAYHVEEDLNKIVFNSSNIPPAAADNVDVTYSAMVPIPVNLDDPVSIEAYCPNNPTTGEKTPFHKTITFTDLIDVDDAINRGREVLNKFSSPFISYLLEVSQEVRLLYPGMRVNVVDKINNYEGELIVDEVARAYPEPVDTIRLSDSRNYVSVVEDLKARMDKLEKEALRNIGLLFIVKQPRRESISTERRGTELQKKVISSGFVVGQPAYSIVGTSPVGITWDSTTVIRRIPGNGDFKEYLYDTDYVDTVTSSDTVNTTTRISTGDVLLQSEALYANDSAITSCDVTIRYSGGTAAFYVGLGADADTPPAAWFEATSISSGVEQTVTLTGANKFLYYKVVKEAGTEITGTKDDYGRWTAPAIRVRNIIEA